MTTILQQVEALRGTVSWGQIGDAKYLRGSSSYEVFLRLGRFPTPPSGLQPAAINCFEAIFVAASKTVKAASPANDQIFRHWLLTKQLATTKVNRQQIVTDIFRKFAFDQPGTVIIPSEMKHSEGKFKRSDHFRAGLVLDFLHHVLVLGPATESGNLGDRATWSLTNGGIREVALGEFLHAAWQSTVLESPQLADEYAWHLIPYDFSSERLAKFCEGLHAANLEAHALYCRKLGNNPGVPNTVQYELWLQNHRAKNEQDAAKIRYRTMAEREAEIKAVPATADKIAEKRLQEVRQFTKAFRQLNLSEVARLRLPKGS